MDTPRPNPAAIASAINQFIRGREREREPASEEKRGARRRSHGIDRTAPTGKNHRQKPETRGADESASIPGAIEPSPEYEKTPEGVLAYIQSLAGSKDYFKKLEEALKSNVALLVPNFISFSDFTKTLSNLRISNMEVERAQGTHTEDPLSAIREFLAGE